MLIIYTAYINSLMQKEINFANQKMGIEIKSKSFWHVEY